MGADSMNTLLDDYCAITGDWRSQEQIDKDIAISAIERELLSKGELSHIETEILYSGMKQVQLSARGCTALFEYSSHLVYPPQDTARRALAELAEKIYNQQRQ